MVRAPALAPLVALAFILACDEGKPGPSVDNLDHFVEEYCEILKPCCGKADLRTDGAQCRTFFALVTPTQRYDPALGRPCLAALRDAAKKADFCAQATTGQVLCPGVFTSAGTLAAGQACKASTDCAAPPDGRVECASSYAGGTERRHCQVQLAGKAGDGPCVGTVAAGRRIWVGLDHPEVPAQAYLCAVSDDLYCDRGVRQCVRIKKPGEACGDSPHECEEGSHCDGASRTCARRQPVGAACTGHAMCVAGAYCGSSRTCAARLADGRPCAQSEACASGRCLNGTCEPTPDPSLALVCGAR
jgi:hypothetical protein